LFGFLLWWVDRMRPQNDRRDVPGWAACIVVGCAQTLALVPGVSRSGATITAGRAMGESRVAAARFSFLLATPITLGAGIVEIGHIEPDLSRTVIAAGVISAGIVGWLAIGGLLRLLGRAGFGGFFAYRVLLAAFIGVHLLTMRGESASAHAVAPRQLVREVAVQPVAQRDARAVQPRLHGGDREVQDLRDLGVR